MKKIVTLLVCLLCFGTANSQEVIYHVFQRSFYDSNGDGHGDLEGIRQKLDYLKELGVTSILLTPLYQSDFYHNYFATNFEKIDLKYGVMKNYRDLVREAHQRGFKIYQDVEMQYVTGRHPWFTESYKNPKSEYSEYLYYNDKNNEKPYYFFDIPEFTLYDNKKEQIIVVNMKSPKVKEYTFNVLKFWADPDGDGNFADGVDGFRLDHMMDNLDNSGKLTNLFADFWQPLLTDLKKINPDLKIVAEQADWASYGHDYLTKGGVDRVFAFRLKYAINTFDKQKIAAAADSTFNYMPKGKEQVVFLENHDTSRFASEEGMNLGKLKVAAALNILIGGIPSIYYGQEIGMKGTQLKGKTDGNDIPIREAFEWYADGEGKGMALWYKDTGMWWDNTNMKPNDGISLEEQRKDKKSLWNFYKELIHIRRSQKAVALGEYKQAKNSNDKVFSFTRSYNGEKVLVFVNLSGEEQALSIQETINVNNPKVLIGSEAGRVSKGGRTLIMPPYDVQVWRLY
ncbi:alpha-amylase family glycosyl hydrolase [Flavobacterium sp. MK4S-17]|uniref:alpha-amylase family glycosyl hydrolase n=1 Tax=Flavobacterium sp. MK4S-17 TaxID=2543737 RepID=UPI001356F370|nr:alpha-amylase family glycosyl hydrolase [Flavobacterium sp. MK4S-17]